MVKFDDHHSAGHLGWGRKGIALFFPRVAILFPPTVSKMSDATVKAISMDRDTTTDGREQRIGEAKMKTRARGQLLWRSCRTKAR